MIFHCFEVELNDSKIALIFLVTFKQSFDLILSDQFINESLHKELSLFLQTSHSRFPRITIDKSLQIFIFYLNPNLQSIHSRFL